MGNTALPTESQVSLDSPDTTVAHAQMIRGKRILNRIYSQHYDFFKTQSQLSPPGLKLELGSGGGFIKDIIPNAITSDLVGVTGIDLVYSALQLPFTDQSVGSIFMINVLHHLQDVSQFFSEATRSLKSGGRVAMVEPANSFFSNFIFKNFHHEPFDPKQKEWQLPEGGRMTSANDALPWIVFCRDRRLFQSRYPQLQIESVQNFMPFSYIISGGVSRKQMIPGSCDGCLQLFEKVISPLNPLFGLFLKIVLTKK